jgi:hypothetical protein
MTRKYVAVIYDDTTQNRLREWATENSFDLGYGYSGEPKDPNDYEFHTTVFYTSNDVDHREQEPGYKLIEKHTVHPIGFSLLGENKDVPVMKVEVSGALAMLRKKYEDLGYQDQWDDYIPHISLSYARKPVDISTKVLPTFPLTFDYVKVEDLME